MTTKCFLIICAIIAITAIYFPTRHARHYDYINIEDIYNELNLTYIENRNSNLKSCNYKQVILNSTDIEIKNIYEITKFIKPNTGGEYVPSYCNTQVKTAIIIPYRNRSKQLLIFLNFMHKFLQSQHLLYRIFVVNQNDDKHFNRAKLLNFGAKVAIDMNYPCLILHDIDLIPLNTGNIYACGRKPRHMSSSLDTFRFNLPYLTLFGGVVSIQSEQFQRINGMSNLYYGWGGEDDDFYKRLKAHDLLPYRFSPKISKYTMLLHKKALPSSERYTHLENSVDRHQVDGLHSLNNNYSIILTDLYTLIQAS